MLHRNTRLRVLSPLLAALVITACTDPQEGALKGGQKKDDGEDPADPPQEVSGSYLTGMDCGYLSDHDEADATTPIGCGLFDKGKKVEIEGREYALSLEDDNGVPVKIETEQAAKSEDWHVKGFLPTNYKANGTLTLSATEGGKPPGSYHFATSKIRPFGETLGTTQDGEGTGNGGGSNSSKGKTPPALQTVAYAAIWRGGPVGMVANAINSADFCNSDGTIRTKLGTLGAQANGMLAGAVPQTITLQAGATSLGDTLRFRSFTLLDGMNSQDRQYAQIGAGGRCGFLRTNNDDLLIIGIALGDPNITEQKLRDYASYKAE